MEASFIMISQRVTFIITCERYLGEPRRFKYEKRLEQKGGFQPQYRIPIAASCSLVEIPKTKDTLFRILGNERPVIDIPSRQAPSLVC